MINYYVARGNDLWETAFVFVFFLLQNNNNIVTFGRGLLMYRARRMRLSVHRTRDYQNARETNQMYSVSRPSHKSLISNAL